MNYDDLKALCETRRSIRSFSEKPVTQEEVLQLLDLARLAPSIENLQPWHFHVIFNPILRKKLTAASCYGNFVDGGGVFIVITANHQLETMANETVWNPKELEYSCMTAAENIMLGATAMGLGSCWVSLHRGMAFDILGLPRHETIVGGLLLGHSADNATVENRERNALETMYTIHA